MIEELISLNILRSCLEFFFFLYYFRFKKKNNDNMIIINNIFILNVYQNLNSFITDITLLFMISNIKYVYEIY